ncbi:MAG: TIGR01777 family oxidoreductase [Myxococcales bacterium]|nr:TIGR01777 family oxidoreductase [Myxococcales bacterium]MDH5307352.1 TIGR01777 family oxidoreductase [Myxococcales bacterium]MDH5567709.1 TIGR01777 family oxidoreductase [Myxococcales bacterium]
MADPRPILVTGATGLVGRRLVATLLGDGRAVRALSRDPASARLDTRVELHPWNGRDAPASAVAGSGAVVHLAGEPVFGGLLSAARRRRIRESRIDSTHALVATLGGLAPAERPSTLLCASAVGIYGSRGDLLLDESAEPGAGFLAEVCVDWEAAALRATALGVRSVCLRTGIVLSREGGALPAMALPFRFGLGGRLGDGRQWFPWIHIDDEVALARAALDNAAYTGPLNAVAPKPVTNAALTRALGSILHRPTLLPVPACAVRVALGDLAEELLGSRRVMPRRALEAGFAFRYSDLEDALRAELG